MLYNYGLRNSGRVSPDSRKRKVEKYVNFNFGRVVSITLTQADDTYSNLLSVGEITYLPILQDIVQNRIETPENLLKAVPANPHFRQYPLIGEIVALDYEPSERSSVISGQIKAYYKRIVNIFNLPYNNALPNLLNTDSVVLWPDIEELINAYPLLPFPGDVTVEGRFGNSIRLSGIKNTGNIYSDDTNNQKPFIIIRNGQNPDFETNTPIPVAEDINLDSSTIFLTSDHTVPLLQANLKRDSYIEPPEEANIYKGAQVVINSDRVFINSKEDSIFLSSNSSIGLNGGNINLDGDDYIGIDAGEIHLGLGAKDEADREPAVLGNRNSDVLNDIRSILTDIASILRSIPGPPEASIALLKGLGEKITPSINSLTNKIERLNSTKVFIEGED